jgi:hypothetical protein
MDDDTSDPQQIAQSHRAGSISRAICACGLFGAGYGALAGALYALILFGRLGYYAHPEREFFVAAVGGIQGAICGLVAGIVSAALGGPGGGCLGGLLGGFLTLPTGLQGGILPVLIVGAFGLVVGFAIRSGLPVLPGMAVLIRTVYGSPLGGWLGWRR